MFWSPETNHSPNMQNAARKQNKEEEEKKAKYPERAATTARFGHLKYFI